MLCREVIAVCSQINTEHINTVCGQNVQFVNVKLAVRNVPTVLSKVKSPNAVMRVLSGKGLMFARHADETTRADLKL
jgi:hypothetical protein